MRAAQLGGPLLPSFAIAIAAPLSALALEPAAIFCDYDCGTGKPSRPGVCVVEDAVFKTHRRGWLRLRTRGAPGTGPNAPPAGVLPEWSELIQADMTWEGYFRLPSAPPETQSLIGTYGANHDTDLYYIGATRRRRHAAVWIHPSGSVSLDTNVGTSSGHITGPNVAIADGQWHHVAAVFERSSGARVTFSMKVDQVEFALLEPLRLVADFIARVKRVVASAADTTMDHVSLVLEEGFVKPLRAVWVRCSINTPKDRVEAMRDRLTIIPWLGSEVARAVMDTPRIYNTIASLDTIVVTSVITLPLVEHVGSARLYVDGFSGTGTVTYEPISDIVGADGKLVTDNVGMDGELVVGGGHKGQALDCEVSRFRLWGVALAPRQLQHLRACTLPSLPSLVGGAWPHGLRAAYALSGTYEDAAGTGFQAIEGVNGGRFEIGGHCSAKGCPTVSAAGCLRTPDRELHFDSLQKCEAFARWVRCRLAGGNRGRPPELSGCGTPTP